MEENKLQELSEVIQSSNINFLFGAGTSTPFLPLLGNIEKRLNEATVETAKETLYKKYFNEVMLPNKKMLNNTIGTNPDFNKTEANYKKLFQALSKLILQRKITILSKQVNIFTTNIDILMEKFLEDLQIEYNDGFSGKFNPLFNLANYKKSINQRSLHFEHISEIPVFNIIKMHGSLSWVKLSADENINFSHSLSHIDESLSKKTGKPFSDEYKKILVVNPEEAKHLESVLNVYYSELLRMYSSELEKENASLFILGFSMEDKHIKEITVRAAKSNPTLRIFICCSKEKKDEMKEKMQTEQNPNIQIFTPDADKEKFTIEYFTDNVINKIVNSKISNSDEH